MARRRRHTTRRHISGPSRLWRVGILVIVAAVGWWSYSLYTALQSKVGTYPADKGHSFITASINTPIILVAESGERASQLNALAVMRVDYAKRSIAVLRLPNNLSDGTTSAGQYLASGYYKELQQMVEQTLALPLSGYLVQTQIVATDSAASWENVLSRQPQPTWWQTTVSLPWWLQQQPALKTNLSTWQLVQTLWVVRDAADAHVTIKDADPSLFFTQDGMTVADTAALDPLVAETFASGDGNSPTISVVVKNATNVTGLASMVARYVKHLGGEVIAVEASDSGQANSSVKSETRTNFSDNMSALVGVPFTPTPRTGRERADAELIVGIDTLNRVGEPSIPAKP